MELKALNCWRKAISYLTPLKGMPLTFLDMGYCPQISDLAPLRGAQLGELQMYDNKVTDITPLAGMPLKILKITYKPERDAAVLRGIEALKTINGKPAAEFWKEVEGK